MPGLTQLAQAIATIFGLLGVTRLVKFTQDGGQQKQALAQVQKLIASNSFEDANSLKAHYVKLQETINTLQQIPNLPGLPYQQAQNDLTQLRSLSAKLESKLQIEEQASANFQTALKLDDRAAKIVKDRPYSPRAWSQAKNKWQPAISLLKKIPADSFIFEEAKAGIAACQRNFSDVGQVIITEDTAMKNLQSATEIAQKAVRLTENPPYTLPDLLNAKSQWQTAIKLLTAIPLKSTVSGLAESQLTNYRQNYRSLTDAIAEVQK